MNHLKARLLALFVIIVFAGLTYFGWRQLMTEGKYSLKLAHRFAAKSNHASRFGVLC